MSLKYNLIMIYATINLMASNLKFKHNGSSSMGYLRNEERRNDNAF